MVVPESSESLRLSSKPFYGGNHFQQQQQHPLPHPRSTSHHPLASSPYHSYLYQQQQQQQRMLGLNPHIAAGHPFQSMFPGLHAANLSAAAAAAAAAVAANNNLPPPPPPPPPPAPSSTPSSPGGVHARLGGGHGGPPGLPGVPFNMWPLIWNHLSNLLPQLSIAKMDPLSQVFCLRWNNHRHNLLTVLDNLLQTEAFCDVTLACDNASIKCHKMILSACSTYFQTLFMENTCEHPIVFLKDIKYSEIRAILDYMYKGEVNVAQEELPGLLKVAELLRVKGLVEEDREKLLNNSSFSSSSGDRDRERERDRERDRSSSSSHRDKSATSGGNKDEPDRERERDRERGDRAAKVNGGLEHHSHLHRNAVIAEMRERDRERERERERHRERVRSADAAAAANVKDSPPSTSSASIVPPMVRPFMYTPPPGAPSFPMFPLPGIFPGAGLFSGGIGSGSNNDNVKEELSSPHKRKKMGSGSGGSSSSKESGNLARDRDDHRDGSNDHRGMDDKQDGNMSDSEKDGFGGNGLDKSGLANYVPNQRLEWKRYKQYTRNDIMAAIEEVKQGMSALQASRKYGVPSRTLYDKVKKMGITTGRQMQKKSLPNYPASFPPLGVMGFNESFKDADDRDDDNDSSLGAPGDLTDGRATMVPPSGFSTLHMLNLMKEMKEAERSGKSDHPINLSTMLSGKRHSDSSLSPRSPQGHYGGQDDEDEDIDDIEDEERDDGVDSSVTQRSRHSSGDIRAQFMADLRRLGGKIPHYNRGGGAGSAGSDEPASSTTVSPPPPHGIRLPLPPPLLHLQPSEDSLPPRKRKVSQEHHQLPRSSTAVSGEDVASSSGSPYNNGNSHDGAEPGSGGVAANGGGSDSSGQSSPDKSRRRPEEGQQLSSPSHPVRN